MTGDAPRGEHGGACYRPVLEGLVPAGGDHHAVRFDPVYAFDGRTVRCILKDLQNYIGSGPAAVDWAKRAGNLIRTQVPDFP